MARRYGIRLFSPKIFRRQNNLQRLVGLAVEATHRVARWSELSIGGRLSRRQQELLQGGLEWLPAFSRVTVFSPSSTASQVLRVRNARVDARFPYPDSGQGPVLSFLQAYDTSGRARCRIRKNYVQFGAVVHKNFRAEPGVRTRVTGSVVYCGGPSQENWHHWLLEVLPSAFHASRDAQVSIAVSNEVRTSPTRLESLNRVFADQALHFVRPSEVIIADEVRISSWWLSWQAVGCKIQEEADRELVQNYVSSLTRGINGSRGHGQRIYLERGPASRRQYNEAECIQVAQSLGFVTVNTGRMSFAEQVTTFSEAQVIVGPSGAAMANLLFTRPGTRAVVIGRPTGSTNWDRIAALRSCDVRGLRWANPSVDSDRLQVDLRELRRAILDVV